MGNSPRVLPSGKPGAVHDRRTGGFRLGADEFGQGVAEVPGESFHLGAGFRLLPILECGDRLGDILLHFLQLVERQCLEILVSH